ncbi:uncharacterized protein [Asterias amurensis]|uniref:uncharacterized protein n=1 Tax=Asterias amurensis TaxID=7602 RepID=UPI003AB6987A
MESLKCQGLWLLVLLILATSEQVKADHPSTLDKQPTCFGISRARRPSTEIPLTEKPSTEITSIPDVTEKDQLNQKLTVYKKALIGVSVGAGILLIVLIFYVMYLNDEKTNMESSQPKKGVYNSKKDNDYEMAADPGID